MHPLMVAEILAAWAQYNGQREFADNEIIAMTIPLLLISGPLDAGRPTADRNVELFPSLSVIAQTFLDLHVWAETYRNSPGDHQLPG